MASKREWETFLEFVFGEMKKMGLEYYSRMGVNLQGVKCHPKFRMTMIFLSVYLRKFWMVFIF